MPRYWSDAIRRQQMGQHPMLVFRQLFDPQSSTYTYLLGDSVAKEAVLIDPVFEQVRRDAALIERARPQARWTLETHVHADHVTGAWLLKQRLGSQIALAEASGAEGADRYLARRRPRRASARRSLEVRATPGHTSGCLTYVLDDESMAFTGDCAADPRLRPHRLPAGRRARALPLGARADLLAARRPACSIRRTTTAA